MRIFRALLFAAVFLPATSALATPIQSCAELFSDAQQEQPRAILLSDGRKIPLHRGLNGKLYAFIFPFVRTEITFVNLRPFVTVYRGIRGEVNLRKASGNFSDMLHLHPSDTNYEHDDGSFGDYIFTSLSSRVAVSYLTRVLSFETPKDVSVLKLRLPLEKAYVAKRKKGDNGDLALSDQFIPAIESRSFMWFKWRAWSRMKELELVWNIKELGGDLSDALYQAQIYHVAVAPSAETGEYTSYENWYDAKAALKRLLLQKE